ncbi:hypothetical protein F5Y04DRAFT_206648 [Hypomontagnella monticulosa]|nr:hypothetical protein F5Y04DRAFT_206648 [Hypomontagnella monticulosa]
MPPAKSYDVVIFGSQIHRYSYTMATTTTEAPLTPRNICANCQKEILVPTLPEIVLHLDNPDGVLEESKRTHDLVCAECYLSTDWAARVALFAIVSAPQLAIHEDLRPFFKEVARLYWPSRPWRDFVAVVGVANNEETREAITEPFNAELYGESTRDLYQEYVALSAIGRLSPLERQDFNVFKENRVLDNIYYTLISAIYYCRHKLKLSDIIIDITEVQGVDKALDFLLDLGELAWNDVIAEKFTLSAQDDELIVSQTPEELLVARANGTLNVGYVEALWRELDDAIAETRVKCYMREEAEAEEQLDDDEGASADIEDVRQDLENTRVSGA